MPPELVLESLCQAGNWLLYLTTDRRQTGALLSVAEASFGGPVHPGDTLLLHGTVESMNDERVIFSGTARVGDRVVLEAREIMCALMPAEKLEDPDSLRRRADTVLRSQAIR
jgi:3-hydroxyacyl-[acyl-carrier-protein] dehydratase